MSSHPTLLLGDCIEVMATLPEASVDAVVTDPPYGLGFMGKDWDTFAPETVARVSARDIRKGMRSNGIMPAPNDVTAWSAARYDRSLLGNRGYQAWCTEWATEALRVLKPGGHLIASGGPRTAHRLTSGIEDAGFEIRDVLSWLYGSGFPKSRNDTAEVLGDEQWEGWGTALKPAWEPCILARKPLIGTIAENVATHGAGAINVDACRIEGAKPDTTRGAGGQNGRYGPLGAQGRIVDDGAGRWPANVLLDEVAAAMLDEQAPASGGAAPASGPTLEGDSDSVARGHFNGVAATPFYGDRGGASRFFYTSKASRSEREAGLDGMDEVRRGDGRAAIDGPGANNPRQRSGARRNDHPTVKPLDLMRWLVTLVTPPGGTVLDPFMGSGTTGVAALELGFGFIGIEREERYMEIARRRMAHERPMRMLMGGVA